MKLHLSKLAVVDLVKEFFKVGIYSIAIALGAVFWH